MKKIRVVIEMDLEFDIPGLGSISDEEMMKSAKPYVGTDLDLMLPLITIGKTLSQEARSLEYLLVLLRCLVG